MTEPPPTLPERPERPETTERPPNKMPKEPPPGFGVPEKPGSIPGDDRL
ncbi:MAG TPA: hypothetical protein VNB64_10225 [Solirubrobacteraceae bacterium]|nr:hypothetical protein [Solirubrobacteraceae bacterium]